jgi:AcrR family transcriptional regulator
MAEVDGSRDENEPAWRQRAVSRSLSAARSRAEQRVQRFMDAAFELIDEKGTTEFTIQEVVDRSKQSLRGFYQYFDGKDDLLLALFEETTRESMADIRKFVDTHTDPIERLRAYVVRLHEWCEPAGTPRKRGSHNRRPISEFSLQLVMNHPERVRASMTALSRILVELLDEAVRADAIRVDDTRKTAVLMQQTVMFSWIGNRIIQNPRMRVSAEETWDYCLRCLRG